MLESELARYLEYLDQSDTHNSEISIQVVLLLTIKPTVGQVTCYKRFIVHNGSTLKHIRHMYFISCVCSIFFFFFFFFFN